MERSTLSPELLGRLSQDEPAWLQERRRQAWASFNRLPLPHRKMEAWKYTDLSHLPLDLPLELPQEGQAVPAEIEARLAQAELAGFLIFAGGKLIRQELPSRLKDLGVYFGPLDPSHPKLAESLFRAVGDEEKFTALNAALFTHGALLYVPRGVVLEEPLGVFHYRSPGVLSASRTLLILEEGAQAVYIEEFLAPPAPPSLSLSVSELLLAPRAQLRHANLQTLGEGFFHFHRQKALLDAGAELHDLVVSFGASLARAEVQSELVGQNSSSEMLGLYFAHGDQHFDHYTLQHHIGRQTRSDLLYKGAVKDRAHAVYSGLIHLEPKAQRTDAYQANRNLLLSPSAWVDSIPQLEIGANDVRCTHGSTTAPLDAEELFYLQSRGIPRSLAEELLVKAHLADVLDRIPLRPLREYLEGVIEEKVRL
jgi:Fe-S cluster assembly protein SufD